MDSRKYVLKATAVVAGGELICTAAMVGIFALLGYYSLQVLLGGLVGGTVAVLNFFFMAVCAMMAADKAQAQDVEGGQKLIKTSRTLRYGFMLLVLFACGKSGSFNLIALVLPLLFAQPILTVTNFFRKPGENQA